MNPEDHIRAILKRARQTLVAEHELGLAPPPVARRPSRPALPAETVTPPLAAPAPRLEEVPDLEALRAFIGDCRRCKLHRERTHLVFGEGSPRPRLVFVGEGPGSEEDQSGRPFVGEAGQLLTRIIENGMGLSREEVYICNVVKCRPPRNRTPERDEIAACLPFLARQLRILKPEIICILGAVAGQALLGADFRITRDRGRWQTYAGIPVMATFHPAYVLRTPSAKRPVWDDVRSIMHRMGLKGGVDAVQA